MSPSPISDHNSGSSQDGTHSDTQISSTPSHSSSLSVQHRKDSARKQRTTSSRRSSEPVSVNNKGKHRREVSPLSHSKVPNGYPSRSTSKGSNHRHSPNLVSSPEVTRSRSRQEREHNTGDINGFDHPVSSSPRLVKRLFKTHSEDSTDSQTLETPNVIQNLFANVTSGNSFSSTSSQTFSSPLTLKAVSLAEVERQITMEESISTEYETNIPETQVTPSSVNTAVLLQPSMFSSPTPVENIAPNGQSGFENRLSPVQTSQLQVNVQPPTPGPGTIKPIFPSIPPLVNSPGMRAFPIPVHNPIPNHIHSITTTPGTVGVVDSTTSDMTHQQRNVEQLSVTPPLLPLSSSSSLMSPMQFYSAPHKSYSEPLSCLCNCPFSVSFHSLFSSFNHCLIPLFSYLDHCLNPLLSSLDNCLIALFSSLNHCLIPLFSSLNHCLVPLFSSLDHCLIPLFSFFNHCLIPFFSSLDHCSIPLIFTWFNCTIH